MGYAYVAVVLIGALAAGAELVSRFRDEPTRIWRTAASWFYVLFNALVSAAALYVIGELALVDGATAAGQIKQVLAAGAGGLALFRSNISLIRIGDKELALNFGLIITSILDMLDREIDRARGEDRIRAVEDIMSKGNFDQAYQSLPMICLTSLQAISTETSKQVGEQLEKVAAANISSKSKSLALGMLLMNVVGESILRKAYGSLKSEIETPPPPPA